MNYFLSVTVPINNISYDLEIHNNYIYASSWAGGLRRFNYYLLDSPVCSTIIPLPMDQQNFLICGDIDLQSYQINPVGDCNLILIIIKHFLFLVCKILYGWGQSGGINKGIVNEDCIDWIHFNSFDNGFFDDWVIGFENQVLSDNTNHLGFNLG